MSAPRDDLAVAEVDAVERADGDAARARLGVGQARDLHARKPTTGFSAAALARLGDGDRAPSASTSRTWPGAPAGAGATRWPWPARRARVAVELAPRGRNAQRVAERQRSRGRGIGVGDVERADRGAPQLLAVGVAQVGDQERT